MIPFPGDWRGTHYSRLGGAGRDHFLRLRRNGSYLWTVVDDEERVQRAEGVYEVDEKERVLALDPGSPDGQARWLIEQITGMEESDLMILLRPLALVSPNLPVLFYLVRRPGEPKRSSPPEVRDPGGPWTAAELSRELERFEKELRDAGLAENSIKTYAQRSATFLRWLVGDYEPRGPN